MIDHKITVALVDDHTLFREGLVNLLNEYEDINILFSVRSGQELKERLGNGLEPQVVLLDINMPVMDGHACMRWIREHFPAIQVLALSMYEDEVSIVKMIRNGASGYVLKESNTEEVVRGIRSIVAQGYYVNELISGRLIHSVRSDSNDDKQKISAREMEFLQHCCSELTYKEIAAEMKISPKTVDNYRESLFEKLQTKSRVGLVLYAIRNRIIDLAGLP